MIINSAFFVKLYPSAFGFIKGLQTRKIETLSKHLTFCKRSLNRRKRRFLNKLNKTIPLVGTMLVKL